MASAKKRGGPCFLAGFSPRPCLGRLSRCHLIPRQLMRREYPYGAIKIDGAWGPAGHPARETRKGEGRISLISMERDERAWVVGCGAGGQGHHGELDVARTLRIPREAIPGPVEGFAAMFGLTWWLDREYGERAA